MLNRKSFALAALALVCGIFLSCSSSLGYSVVLWNNPEIPVNEGEIVKVYIKSNISHVYVIQVPGTNTKSEIPLWQLSEPASKGKALKTLNRFSEYAHTYASVKLDGLPIRQEAINTSKQVYRLRKGEIIRILYKGSGAAPTNGRGNLQGEWLRVLTNGGTMGWCFSYNLDLFERITEDINSSIVKDSREEEVDEAVVEMLAKKWYPDYYISMINSGRYDLNLFTADYGFSFGNQEEELHTARIKKQGLEKAWDYKKLNKTGEGEYRFDELQLSLTQRGANTIVIQYMDSDGKIKVENFVALEQDIQELINTEVERRTEELRTVMNAGPVFKSSNYGTIEFTSETTATWNGYGLLVPSVISEKNAGGITISVTYYLDGSLKKSYDGILTFKFDSIERPVNFLYKMTNNGLRLEDATRARIKDGVVTSRASSPLVMFFAKK